MPIPSNGQNFVRPQSGGSGGWISKLFGGVGDAARAKQMAQIQFDLHQAKAGVDTEHQGTRVKQKVAAESAGKILVGDADAKRAIRTFKKFTDPKEEYTDAKGRKRTRGGFGLQVESAISHFDSNMMPGFQKTGLDGRGKGKGAAPVNSDATDGGEQTTGGGTATPPKKSAKKTGSQPRRKNSSAAKASSLPATPSSTPVATSTNGEAKPELFPGFGMDVTPPTLPQPVPASPKTAKTPKTPKAGK
jgi:hypothetical protein